MREHVVAVVVHDLQALDLRIDVERFVELLLHAVPVVLLHTARRVDDEDDVLAVHGNAGDSILVGALVVGLQAPHLLRQPLLRGGQRAFVDRRVRFLLRGFVLALHRVEFLLQACELDLRVGGLLAHVLEFAIQDRRLAADVEEFLLQ